MFIFIILGIIALDQITKLIAIKNLKGQRPFIIIKDFFQFHYVENRGAAFGILEHQIIFFVIITLLIIAFIFFYIIKHGDDLSVFSKLSFSLLIAGAIGNLIDRIRLGYVVDFISVRLFGTYDFPVFNIADIAIVLGTISIMLLIVFNKIEIGD